MSKQPILPSPTPKHPAASRSSFTPLRKMALSVRRLSAVDVPAMAGARGTRYVTDWACAVLTKERGPSLKSWLGMALALKTQWLSVTEIVRSPVKPRSRLISRTVDM